MSSVRLTSQQIATDPVAYVVQHLPPENPLPTYIDVGKVQMSVLDGPALAFGPLSNLVAFSFPASCIVRDPSAEGGNIERYRYVPGYFVVVVERDGDMLYAEHTAAGAIYPLADVLVRTADDVENPRPR